MTSSAFKRVLVIVGLFSTLPALGQESDIGYASPAEALEALREKPDAIVSVEDGWIIVTIQTESELSLWSFTPEVHPAHPAAIKRSVVERDGNVVLVMNVLCEGLRPDCDALVEEFQEINRQISASFGAAQAE